MNVQKRNEDEICIKCYNVMEFEDGSYSCPFCGWGFTGEGADYEEFDEYEYDEDDIPAGCIACGGPYPDCISSCNLIDK